MCSGWSFGTNFDRSLIGHRDIELPPFGQIKNFIQPNSLETVLIWLNKIKNIRAKFAEASVRGLLKPERLLDVIDSVKKFPAEELEHFLHFLAVTDELNSLAVRLAAEMTV